MLKIALAENSKPSVINTTLSIVKQSMPHYEVTTPHGGATSVSFEDESGATSEDEVQSSDTSVFVVPQTKVPFVSFSTVLSAVTTVATFVTGKICTLYYF